MCISLIVVACDQGVTPQSGVSAIPDIPIIQGTQLDAISAARLENLYARIERDPRNADANGELGMLLQGYGFLDAAIACYLRAQHFAPDVFEWPYFLGFAYASNGQLDQAAASLSSALAQRSDFIAAQIKLARVYLDLDDMDGSERMYRSAIEAQPGLGEPYYGLGRIEMRRGNANGAIQLYEKAYELSGHSADLHYAMAQAWLAMGNASESQAQLELFEQYRDLPIRGNSPLPAAVIAYASEDKADVPEQPEASTPSSSTEAFDIDTEIRALEADLANDSSDPGLYASLMVLYGRKGDVVKAVSNYEMATQGMGMNPDLHFVAGNVFLSLQAYEQAQTAFSRVLQSQPNNANAHHQIGVTFDYLGDGEAAKSHYRNAIALDPDRKYTRSLLGRRLTLSGAYDEALRNYQETPGDTSVPAWVAMARAGKAEKAGDTAARDHWLAEAARIAEKGGDEEIDRAADRMKSNAGAEE